MGLELELPPSQLPPPIRTAAAPTTPRAPDGDDDNDNAVADGGCATPKSAANVLRAPSACPPAPRKPRPPAKRKLATPTTTHHRGCSCSCTAGSAAPHPAPVRWFIAVPQDVLAAAFVARRPAPATCPTSPPASKKIRVHVVG